MNGQFLTSSDYILTQNKLSLVILLKLARKLFGQQLLAFGMPHAIMLSHLAIKLASFTPFCLIPNVLTIKSDHTIHSLVINDVKVPFSQGRNNRG